ncbi:hypothetical protein PV331_44165 [Streptomyces sp. WI04-05B]|uniref:hypothetical protein n=1 Tax=Streptomyces echiniscabiei TaxID=3028708 RepID=UPI0029A8C608|nr:hypothetical protein [Streptomyces sp. WI04-05B]MDX2548778.1 hypothetical protein [Streptomyces sp. WI04-05B]
MIRDGIDGWEKITENGDRSIDLTGLPDLIAAELAWMAHWQAMDGTRSSVLGTNQFANILRRAIRDNHPSPRRSGPWTGKRWPPCSGGSMPPAGAGSFLAAVSPD